MESEEGEIEEDEEDSDEEEEEEEETTATINGTKKKWTNPYHLDQFSVRLELGEEENSNPNMPFLTYQVHNQTSVRKAMMKLTTMALSDFLGREYDLTDELSIMTPDHDEADKRFAWEPNMTQGNVEAYLGGLLWNLQTYQDGVCADYR